jgi:membrane protein
VLAGTLWAASGELFAEFVAGASRTEAIYSGFAIVIVAMIWLYVSWLILLLGAQFTFYHQNPDCLRLGRSTPTISNGLRERLAMSVMLLIATDFDQPSHGWRVPSLAATLGIPRHILEPIVGALHQCNLIVETTEQRLVPTRDLRRISLADILDAVRGSLTDPDATASIPWNVTIDTLSQAIDSSILDALNQRTLADLVDEDERRVAREAL